MTERIFSNSKKSETKQTCPNSCKQKPGFISSGSSPDRILQLQRTAGNQAVQRLLKSGILQAKLRISQPNGIYEQEADRVAEQVMRMSNPILQRKCTKCDEDKKKVLQTKKNPELNTELPIRTANKIGIQLKQIGVGDTELPNYKDLNFTIATVLGESSPVGSINESLGIAMVIKKRVENKLRGNSNFRDVILKTGIYGNPSLNKIANLAELYLNNKTDDLEKFQAMIDQAKITGSDKSFLATKNGFLSFVKRIELTEKAVDTILKDAPVEPDIQVLKEATWWGGANKDFLDRKTCKIWKHGKRIMENELVFVTYKIIGETYFLKEAKSISDESVRTKEIEESKKFLCGQLANKVGCKREAIIKENPMCNSVIKGKRDEILQPKGISDRVPEIGKETELLLDTIKGNGQPLSNSLRSLFEPLFGQDFSRVKIHTGANASKAASEVNSRAFTVGNDVVFGEGEYAPETNEGKKLMAHELTHVVQQGHRSYSGNTVESSAESRTIDHKKVGRIMQVQSSLATLHRQTSSQVPEKDDTEDSKNENKSDSELMSRGVSLKEVISWTEKLFGLPYAFSADDTVGDLIKKEKELQSEIKTLNKKLESSRQLSKPSTEKSKVLLKAEEDLNTSKKNLDETRNQLQVAREEYWEKTLKELVTKKVGTKSAEIINAVHKYGIVCNTFIEIAMRLSGFVDFPLTDQPYLPKSEKYKKIESERSKVSKARRSGWGLDWAERMVDWASSNGEVVYDDLDISNRTLPSEPKEGDIVIFRRGSDGYHVNIVVLEKERKFNFAGARGSGKDSGKALLTPFEKYDDTIKSKKGLKDIPNIMGQEKYLWILRPKYTLSESKSSKDVPEKEK